MTDLAIEKFWPFVLSATITMAWLFVFPAPFPKNADPLLGSMVAASAVLIGFLATAKTIIFTLTEKAIFLKLKQSGYNDVFFSYLKNAYTCGTILLVLSILGFFVCEDNIPVPKIYTTCLVFSGALAISTFHHFVSILFKVLKKV